MIANKDFVLSKLNELTTYAKKNFGQNFLIDDNICQKIVKSLEVQDDNKVIEIGPGLGALSYHLSSYSDVTLYDIDEDMVNHLNSYFKFNNNIKVIKEDFLKVNLDVEEKPLKVIGNLPYYITTPLIEKVLLAKSNVKTCVFMIQKEVYSRLTAKVNSKEYSPLSILIEHVGTISKVLEVSRNCFYPAPHVDSLVFKVELKDNIDKEQTIKLYSLLNKLFLMRRKTILNNLTTVTKSKERAIEILEYCKIDVLKRPENLTLINYLDILNALSK